MYMNASNFATLINTHFILLHEYTLTPWINELNDPLALLIMTGRYIPDSMVWVSETVSQVDVVDQLLHNVHSSGTSLITTQHT